MPSASAPPPQNADGEQRQRSSEEEAAILRATTYHRDSWDRIGICPSPDEKREHPGVRASVLEPFRRLDFSSSSSSSSSSLGALSRLPPELLANVLLELDVLSVFRFRGTNNLARHVAFASPQYRAVATHALSVLHALLLTGVAPRVTLNDLWDLVSDSGACAFCGLFGPVLFIPTLQRCCFPCIQTSPKLAVVSAAAAAKASALPPRRLKEALLAVHTVPGEYGLWQQSRTRRRYLVSCAAVLDAFGASCPEPPADKEDPEVARCMAVTALPHIDRASPLGKATRHLSCKGCQAAVERRPIPSDLDLYRIRDRCYTARGFLEHFGLCADAQALWESSKGLSPQLPQGLKRKRRRH